MSNDKICDGCNNNEMWKNIPIIEEVNVNMDQKYIKYILEYKTEIEDVKEIEKTPDTIKERFIMKTFVKIDGDCNFIKEEFVEVTTIDIKFE